MKIVDVDPDNLHWPARCCRCGSKDYEMREHVEKVNTSRLLMIFGVTSFKVVTLTIPVCQPCMRGGRPWFGACFGAAALGGLLLKFGGVGSTPVAVLLLAAAAVFAFVAMGKRPLKVLRVNKAKGTLRLKIHDDMVGAQLRRTVPSKHAPIRS